MNKLFKAIRWRYRMWRRQTFVSYVVEDGIVYMNVAKTGFFKPLHKQFLFRIDTKTGKWEARRNAPPTMDQISPQKISPA